MLLILVISKVYHEEIVQSYLNVRGSANVQGRETRAECISTERGGVGSAIISRFKAQIGIFLQEAAAAIPGGKARKDGEEGNPIAIRANGISRTWRDNV